ncbi:unnamed protein product [Chironomus riparius]|uniref:Enoyl-CoA delta isomerase 1, mitochondrial n=1 Tax=Chironomus riparius TaxID=315576 RepID=A0A9N9RGC6_9DIPT|nr:unnamed protein product [Chironomus riparius]
MSAIKLAFNSWPMSRNLFNYARSNVNKVKYQSTKSGGLVLIDVNDKTGYALVTLNSPPVNSLNLELLTAFSNALDEVKNNKSKGMILTSSSPTVFTAGLDINEMYKPDYARARKFWSSLQDCWLKLYGSSFPTAAAINGHSPAGGCLFAMCCEYRVMLPKYTIGLNETKLGIVAPAWFMASMKNTIPIRKAEMALTLGTLFSTEEALKLGLVDEIAKDKAEAIAKCEAFLKRYEKIPQMARGATKQLYRQQDIKELESSRGADVELFITTIKNDKIQTSLGRYIAFLKWKKRLKPLIQFVSYVTRLVKPQKKKKTTTT